MNRREFIGVSVGGLLSTVFAGAEPNSDSDGALEDNVIYRDLYKSLSRYPHGRVSTGVEHIGKTLSIIENHSLELTGEYEEGTIKHELQKKLRLDTRSLYGDVCFDIKIYGKPLNEEDIPNSLQVLAEVEETFGNHPFHHVIIGRQKGIVRVVRDNGLIIPDRFQKYVGADIPLWQKPNLNYERIDDLRNSHDGRDGTKYIPPEYK